MSTAPFNLNSLRDFDIAYISCDDGAYIDSRMNATATFTTAYQNSPQPAAIVLYSADATRCILTPNDNIGVPVYSMKDSNSSADVLQILESITTITGPTTISPHESDNGGGGILGKSPTTAVAMIILYSITGLITALFLIIIIVGAFRAHRHPERYGPRNMVGRPRQSRAKGLARAMLETLPIVKFGDNENPKPVDQHGERDIEMAPPQTAAESSIQEPQPPNTENTSQSPKPAAPSENTLAPAEPASSDPMANADNGLACSVCVDDFTKGQDVRVLPCNHKFHPECIDPWLLNVSGTCPLCRVDLRPTNSGNEVEATDPPPRPRRHSEALTSFNAAPRPSGSRRHSRARPLHYLHHYLNRGRMEEATPQERLEALRSLRLVNREDVETASENQDGETRRGSRLSTRLSRAFGGDRSRPVSGVPSTHTVPPAVPEVRNEPADDSSGPEERRERS